MSSWRAMLGRGGSAKVDASEKARTLAEADGQSSSIRDAAPRKPQKQQPSASRAATGKDATAGRKGILRSANRGGSRHHRGHRIKWRAVLVGDDASERHQEVQRRLEEEAASRERRERFQHYAKIARLPILSVENFLIPLRLAMPVLLASSPAAIGLDVLCDFFELCWVVNALENARREARAAEADAAPGGPAQRPRYSLTHAARDLVVLCSLHAGRALTLLTGHTLYFEVLLAPRLMRVRELIHFIDDINNDLSTSVSFLAVYKFGLVLVMVPHWVACAWWLIATRWASGEPLELPHWTAQFELLTGNEELDPFALSSWETYLMALYMAWAGMTAMGYGTLVITVQSEIIFAIVISLVQIVFYAFVFGTLFHYLVRTDEATVHAKQLLKAVDEYTAERKLPAELAARIRGHFEFQHRKSAAATERIFSQMPLSLKTEVAVEQYARELGATPLLYACSPQFLNQLALYLRERYVMPQETVLERGEGATELLWCLGGSLFVKKADLLVSTIRSDLGPGQIVGEVAFFAGVPQPYTVLATPSGEVTLAVLTSIAFEEIVGSYPEQADLITVSLLRGYGLDKMGQDLPGGAVGVDLNALSEDEQKEHEALREMIRGAIAGRNEDQLSQMLLAVWQGDTETVRTLTARGFDLDAGTYDQRTTLHLAALQGNVAIVKLLCELGADVNVKDRFGSVPLNDAVDKQHSGVAEELAKHGAELQLERPASSMHAAARSGSLAHLRMLLAYGVEVNAADYDARTALHVAASNGAIRVVEYLLTSMADVDARDRWGRSALDEAIQYEHTLVARLLAFHSATPDEPLMRVRMRTAAAAGDAETLRFLIDMGAPADIRDYDERTALHYAVQAGSISATHLLVSSLADVNLTDRWGRPPIVDALQSNHEIAALLSHAGGAEVPAEWADAVPSSALQQAQGGSGHRMYALTRKVQERARTRQADADTKRNKTHEVTRAISKLGRKMHDLARAQRSLFRTLGRHADLWINEYGLADESADDDTDSDPSDGDSDSDSDGSGDGGTAAAAALVTSGSSLNSDANGAGGGGLSSQRFIKLVLQLPKAEQGLTTLRAAFAAKLSPSDRRGLPDRERRRAEDLSLTSLLVLDLGLSPEQAQQVRGEIYAELFNFIGVPMDGDGAAGVRGAAGSALAEVAEADEQEQLARVAVPGAPSATAQAYEPARPEVAVLAVPKRTPGGTRRFPTRSAADATGGSGSGAASPLAGRAGGIARRGSGTGMSLVELSRHLQSVDEEHAAREAAAGAGPLAGLGVPEPPVEYEPIFLSDLGHAVLFCSPAFLGALAEVHARAAAGEGAARQSGAADGEEGTVAKARRKFRLSANSAMSAMPPKGSKAGSVAGSNGRAPRGSERSCLSSESPSTTLSCNDSLSRGSAGSRSTRGSGGRFFRGSVGARSGYSGASGYSGYSGYSPANASARPSRIGADDADSDASAPASKPAAQPPAGSESQAQARPNACAIFPINAAPSASDASAAAPSATVASIAQAMHIVSQLFAVFDVGRHGAVRLRDVRQLQGALGEMGSDEIRSFLSFLVESSRAFAPTAADRQLGVPEEQRRGSPQPRRSYGDSPHAQARRSHGSASPAAGSPLGASNRAAPVAAGPSGTGSEPAASALSPVHQPSSADPRRANVAPAPPPADDEAAPAAAEGAADSAHLQAAVRSPAEAAARGSADTGRASGGEGEEEEEEEEAGAPEDAPLFAQAPPPASALVSGTASGTVALELRRRGRKRPSNGLFASQSSVLGAAEGWRAKSKVPKQMTKVQFVIGVTSWILLSADGEGEAEADGGADGADDLKLSLASVGGGPLSQPLQPSQREDLAVVESSEAKARGAALDSARLKAELDDVLVTHAACHAISDSISQRIETNRLKGGELATAPELLHLVAHVATLPAGTRAQHISAWCAEHLGLELETSSVDAVGSALTAAAAAAAGEATAGLRVPGGSPAAAAAAKAAPAEVAAAVLAAAEAEEEGGRVTWSRLASALQHKAAELRAKSTAGGAAAAALLAAGGGAAAVAPDTLELEARPWHVLSIHSAAYKVCHAVLLGVCLLDFLLIPLQLAFVDLTEHMAWLSAVNYACDALYILHVALRFNVSHVNEASREVFAPREIRKHYRDTDFTLDAFASWPHNWLLLAVGVDHVIVASVRLLRLLNLRHLWRAVRAWQSRTSEQLGAELLKFLATMLFTAHVCACAFYVFGYTELAHEHTSTTWADLYRVQNKAVGGVDYFYESTEARLFDKYIVSLFMIVSMLTTLGVAQLPANVAELGFYLAMFVLNMTVYAWTVGGISGVVMKLDDEVVAKRAQLELVDAYLAHISVSAELKERMRKYFIKRLQSASLSNVTNDEIYAALPMSLQMEVSQHVNRSLVGNCSLLRGCSDAFLNRLSSMLREREVEAETMVFRAGDACKELLFLGRGAIEMLSVVEQPEEQQTGADDELLMEVVDVLGEGDTLGDMQFVFGIRHIVSARVAKGADAFVFSLSRERYRDLLKLFPSQEDVVMDNAVRQYDGVVTSRTSHTQEGTHSRRTSVAASEASGFSAAKPSEAGSAAPSVTARSTVSVGSAAGRSYATSEAPSDARSAAASLKSFKESDLKSVQTVVTVAKRKRRELQHSRLCTACSKGELDTVMRLLATNQLDINFGDFSGRAALHLAACGGNTRVVELLLAARAEINVEDKRGATPLADALANGQAEVAELLAARGGRHGSQSLADALCDAAHTADGSGLAQLRRLTQYGGDANAANAERRTALHIAAADGNTEAVRLLLEHRADVNVTDRSGGTPLRDALLAREDGAAAALLQNGGELGDFDAALHMCRTAAADDAEHLARLLRVRCDVNAADTHGRTALHLAASRLHVRSCHFLLTTAGLDVNAEDQMGHTALDDALREEPSGSRVLSTLISAHGGRRGSAKPHISAEALAARRADIDRERLQRVEGSIAARDALLAKLRALDEWVGTEQKAVARVRSAVDDALQLERAHGAVLADQRPELWSTLLEYSESHHAWFAHAARSVQPSLLTWGEESKEVRFAAKPLKSLHGKLKDVLRVHDEGARAVERLCEVDFRPPKQQPEPAAAAK